MQFSKNKYQVLFLGWINTMQDKSWDTVDKESSFSGKDLGVLVISKWDMSCLCALPANAATSWAVFVRAQPVWWEKGFLPSLQHWRDHIWALGTVWFFPVQERHGHPGAKPVSVWSTQHASGGGGLVQSGEENAKGSTNHCPQQCKRGLRTERDSLLEVHGDENWGNMNRLQQGKFWLDNRVNKITMRVLQHWPGDAERLLYLRSSRYSALEILKTRHNLEYPNLTSKRTCFEQEVGPEAS